MVEQAVISIRPSDMVEGGAVPVEKNLLWDECRFKLYDYKNKAGEIVATTIAAVISYKDDDGQEFEQAYSAGDPARFAPSADGKTLVAVGSAQALNKSSNFFLLMSNLISAGFPENKLTGDISILDGLYTYNIGVPEPKRSGMAPRPAQADGTPAREKILSVPSKVLRLPWEKKGGSGKGAVTAPKAGKAASKEDAGDALAGAIVFVKEAIAEGESMTRQDLAVKVFKDLAGKPNQNAIASIIFKAEFSGALMANGFTLDGETITRG